MTHINFQSRLTVMWDTFMLPLIYCRDFCQTEVLMLSYYSACNVKNTCPYIHIHIHTPTPTPTPDPDPRPQTQDPRPRPKNQDPRPRPKTQTQNPDTDPDPYANSYAPFPCIHTSLNPILFWQIVLYILLFGSRHRIWIYDEGTDTYSGLSIWYHKYSTLCVEALLTDVAFQILASVL